LIGIWNELIQKVPGAHFLQSSQWAQVKSQTGWKATYLAWEKDETGYRQYDWRVKEADPQAAALILERKLTVWKFKPNYKILYSPKGPLLDWGNTLLRETVLVDLQSYARSQRAIMIKIDPDVILGTGVPGSPDAREDSSGSSIQDYLDKTGWKFSQEQIQFRNTVRIDLGLEESVLLERMKQKTRYNIRLAQRKGVTIRTGSSNDLQLLADMYGETALRDGFVIRDKQYYLTTWQIFLDAGLAVPLIAEFEGEAIAALILFRFSRKAWYVYGMSTNNHREKMPNYLLQWEAIIQSKKAGCLEYDLWGAPEVFDDTDQLFGVFRFKEGLGGVVVRTLGAWDFAARPGLNRLVNTILPRFLNIIRKKGLERMKEEHSQLTGN
jgi:lipid II:glycine glycyltransferase (peptidoglycan interpeptide bridge formation enzyme)